jgi:hypothetical protein
MFEHKFRRHRRAAAQAMRLQPIHQGRLTLALVGLLSIATVSVLATTNSVSRHHAEHVSVRLQR